MGEVVKTEAGLIQIGLKLVANSLIAEGNCSVEGAKDARGIRTMVWFGRMSQLPDEVLEDGHLLIVNPADYVRIESLCALAEEPTPFTYLN